MKKLIFLFAIASLSFCSVNAQSVVKKMQSNQGINAAGLDTVTNTGSIAQIAQLPGYVDLITIQSAVTKLTGTVGGSVKLFGSVDGVRYDVATTATDTLAVTNVSTLQVKTWKIAPSPFQFYKVIYKGAGTQTSTVSSTILSRRK